MTPKEKAFELHMKFRSNTIGITDSIKCSVIAADEIIAELECAYNGEPITTNEHQEFWKEVKIEIEKL